MSMGLKGECTSCSRVSVCKETSIQRILDDYTCLRYEGVLEPEYLARMQTRATYGDRMLAEVLLQIDSQPGGPTIEHDESQ